MKNYIYILSLLLLAACGEKTIQEQSAAVPEENIITLTPAQYKSAGILLSKAELRNISSTIKVNGKIDVPPQNMVSVSMPLGGYLKTTNLLPGVRVKQGEVIATMEDMQYIQLQQDYLMVKSRFIYAESEFERQKELNQSKASSDKVFQQTQMEYTTQQISLQALAEKLKLIHIDRTTLSQKTLSKSINIYSPITGFVSKVNANIGKYVNPSDVLFELVNPSDIHLNLKVFEKDLDKLFIGQKLVAYNNNEPGKKHPCEIILISQDISPNRTAEVHCHFEEFDKTLLPGMYMNADVEIKLVSANSVPQEAIVSYENKDFVFVAKGKDTFEMLEIIKGASENNYTEINFINKADNQGEEIVVHGAYSLLMQLKNREEE